MDLNTAKFNALSPEKMQEFVENYAERIVDDMSTKCLMQFVYDTIVENLSIQTPEDILDEITSVYDDETVAELIESVTDWQLAQGGTTCPHSSPKIHSYLRKPHEKLSYSGWN